MQLTIISTAKVSLIMDIIFFGIYSGMDKAGSTYLLWYKSFESCGLNRKDFMTTRCIGWWLLLVPEGKTLAFNIANAESVNEARARKYAHLACFVLGVIGVLGVPGRLCKSVYEPIIFLIFFVIRSNVWRVQKNEKVCNQLLLHALLGTACSLNTSNFVSDFPTSYTKGSIIDFLLQRHIIILTSYYYINQIIQIQIIPIIGVLFQSNKHRPTKPTSISNLEGKSAYPQWAQLVYSPKIDSITWQYWY